MNVLALNAGSTTLKASLFDLAAPGPDGAPPHGMRWEADGDAGPQSLDRLLAALWTGPNAPLSGPAAIDVVGHRVVDGGPTLRETERITPAVRAAIATAAEQAPAHNAAALALIDEAGRIFGAGTPQIAVFDTAFHRTMPPAAYTYAGPYAWLAQGIRRLGFHGINHDYVSHRAARLLDHAPAGLGPGGLRIVSCHLGGGCSLAAVQDGRSVDTTMGYTPLDGLPMARRSGAVDPGILLHLLRREGYTPDALDHLLNHDSGLAGLSGTDGDMRHVLAGVDAEDERAGLALDVFVHHVRQGIAAMAASMAGIDVLVFTGGIGEHTPRVRASVCASLAFLGVAIDPARNMVPTGEVEITGSTARVRTFVIPAAENWMIARECVRVLGATTLPPP